MCEQKGGLKSWIEKQSIDKLTWLTAFKPIIKCALSESGTYKCLVKS